MFYFSYVQEVYDEVKTPKNYYHRWRNEEKTWTYRNCSVKVIGIEGNRVKITIIRKKSGYSTFMESNFEVNLVMDIVVKNVQQETIEKTNQLVFDIEQGGEKSHRDLKDVRIWSDHVHETEDLYNMINQIIKSESISNIRESDQLERYNAIVPVIYQPKADALNNFLREVHVYENTKDSYQITLVFEDDIMRRHGVLNGIYSYIRLIKYKRTVDIITFSFKNNTFFLEYIYSQRGNYFKEFESATSEISPEFYFQDKNHPILFVNTIDHALAPYDNNPGMWKWEYVPWAKNSPVKLGTKTREQVEQSYQPEEKDSINQSLKSSETIEQKVNYNNSDKDQLISNKNSEEIKNEHKQKLQELSAHTATDKWVTEDSLGYKVYAHSIYKFLTHNKTIPPLTINIQAPWGGGKTSIMRMVQNRLDPEGIAITTGKERKRNKKENVKLKQIISVLKGEKPKYDLKNFESIERFTVWFNPWKYQNTEQIWAGLAHSIITQFSERFSEEEREKFLLELNLKRTGKENPLKKIKKQIFDSWKEQIQKPLLVYLSGLVGSVLAIFVGLLDSFPDWLISTGEIGAIGSILVGGIHSSLQFLNTENKVKEESAVSVLGKFVEIPDYSSKLGTIHHVHEDLQRVFEIISDKLKKDSEKNIPIIIFIDDLDRCSPGKVAEVIESINLFISAEFSNCIFVMGMDTQIVASALEKHYQDIIEKLPEYSKQSSMGWKFMDKFVQLPVIIPPPDSESARNYVNSLLLPEDKPTPEQEKAKDLAKQVDEKELNDIESTKDIENTVQRISATNNNNKEFSNELKKQVTTKLQKHRIKKAEEEIDKASSEWSDQNPETQEQVSKAAADFSDNPREIKRFLNVLRFNEVTQEGRKELKLNVPTSDVLRRWIILTMKWPQVSLWIQRGNLDSRYDRVSTDTTHKQLEKLEEFSSKSMTEWKKMLTELLQIESHTESVPWIKDESLKKFFERENNEKGMKLSQAVGMGLY